MGPPGVLCQGRQSPSSTTMAPLFLLHYFPAVSFALSVHAMLFLYVPRFWPCVPRIELVAAMVAWPLATLAIIFSFLFSGFSHINDLLGRSEILSLGWGKLSFFD